MRAVLDTNIIVSALIAPAGKPAAIFDAWLDGRFTLLTCAAHVDEPRATLQKPRVAELVKPHKAGRLVNQVKKLAEDIDPLPRVERSPDPTDDFLLALRSGRGRLSGDRRQEWAADARPPQRHANSVGAGFRCVARITSPANRFATISHSARRVSLGTEPGTASPLDALGELPHGILRKGPTFPTGKGRLSLSDGGEILRARGLTVLP
jgi:hypothetical protein